MSPKVETVNATLNVAIKRERTDMKELKQINLDNRADQLCRYVERPSTNWLSKKLVGVFTLLMASTLIFNQASAAPDIIEVDLSQLMILSATGTDVNYGVLPNNAQHPINRYDLFCQDNDAAKPTEDWQRSIPAILSSYVKLDSNQISAPNTMDPGAGFQCVGKEVLKRLITNLSGIENLHSFVNTNRRIKQTETKLTWTTSSGVEFEFIGAKSNTSIDLSAIDATQGETYCTGLKGDWEPSTKLCQGSMFQANALNINESFWQLGQVDGKFTDAVFDPAFSLDRRSLLDRLNGVDWSLRLNFFNRLAIETPTIGTFNTYYYCQSSVTRTASGDFGCGDNRTVWLDSAEQELVGTATELVRSREDLAQPNSALKLHVLQTGPGNCVVLECPGNKKAVLIDCGSTSKRVYNAELFGIPPNFDSNTNADTERLAATGTRIGSPKSLAHAQNILKSKDEISLIVSHGDADHKNLLYNVFYEDNGGGVDDLYKNINSFYFGGNFQKTSDDTKTHRFFERLFNHFDSTTGKFALGPDEEVGGVTVKTKTLPQFFASAGNRRTDSYSRKPAGFKTYTTPVTLGSTEVCKVGGVGAEVRIVAANEYGREVSEVKGVARDPNPNYEWTKKNSHTTNGNAIILEISYAGRRIVIPGDAERGALNWAVDPENPHRITNSADILLASHHGADGHGKEKNLNITRNWVEALDPSYLIYTHGHQHGHPKLGTYGEADGDNITTKANTEESPTYFRPGSSLENQANTTTITAERQIRFNNADKNATLNRKVYNVKSNVYSTMAQGSITFAIEANGEIKVDCLGPTVTPWEVKAGKNIPGYCKPID